VGASGGLNFAIFGIALFKGEKQITLPDKICLVAAFLGIAVWAITTDPLWSVVIVTVIDAVGFIPTFRKAYKKPAEESTPIFILAGISYFVSLFAISTISLTTVLYPASLFVMDVIFVLMVLHRRRIDRCPTGAIRPLLRRVVMTDPILRRRLSEGTRDGKHRCTARCNLL
jgi:hypothetical protein